MEHWIESYFEELQAGNPEAIDELRNVWKEVSNSVVSYPVYTFRNQNLASITGEIEDTDDPSELTQLLWMAATSLNFQHVSISAISTAPNRLLDTRLATSLPRHWVQEYCDRHFFGIDPILWKASEEEELFTFSELELSNPILMNYWTAARKAGIPTNGICVPVSTFRGDKVAVSFLSHASADTVRHTCRRYGCDLAFLSKVASNVFLDVCTVGSAEGSRLTHDEIHFLNECLHSEDIDVTAKEIRPLFGTSAPIWNSVQRKLNVNTLTQAIALAHRVGWLDEALPRSDKVVGVLTNPLTGC